MNVLFITLFDIRNVQERGIYSDLMRAIADEGHNVYIASSVERKHKMPTQLSESISQGSGSVQILKIRTGNMQKTNLLEKGISTLLFEGQICSAIRKHFKDIVFDLVLYSTPPITMTKAVRFVKKRDGAITYLMLKDIFPQNSVDLGMLKTKGIFGLLYRYFKRKEKKLYNLSDYIGCMSEANVQYLLQHHKEIAKESVGLCPNSIYVEDGGMDESEKVSVREKYGLPTDKRIFIYGGNLGRPQAVPFIIEGLQTQLHNSKSYFLIVGNGTDYPVLEKWFSETKPANMKLLQHLPKEEYEKLVAACDVGMIFLDYRFTIPNFPSRLLSYMQACLPVIACTDRASDIGKVVEEGGFGYWCPSNNAKSFCEAVAKMQSADLTEMGNNAYAYLQEYYDVKHSAQSILKTYAKVKQ